MRYSSNNNNYCILKSEFIFLFILLFYCTATNKEEDLFAFVV